MKKFYFLFLFALIASISNLYAAEKTVTYKFTSKTWEAKCDGVAANWTSIVDANDFIASKPAATGKTNPSAESPVEYTKIKSIEVSWATSKSGKGTIAVYVGGVMQSTVNCTSDASNKKTTIMPKDRNGKVKFVMTRRGGNVYLPSISITYEDGTSCGVPTFNVEEGTYPEAQTIALAPGEGGEKVFYTINDGPEQQYIDEPIKLEEDGTYKITAYTAATETLAKSASVTKTYIINFPLDEPYILCENAAWLTEGTKIIFVGEKNNKYYGLSGDADGVFLTGGLVTISAKELTEKDVTVKVFVVGRTANGVTFNTAAGYLAAGKTAKAANLSYAAGNEGDCFHWTVSVANGEATVVNADVTGDYNNLQFNPSAKTPRFGAYADSYKNGNLSIYLLGSTSSVSSMSAEGVKVFATEGGVEVVAEEAAEVAVYTAAGQLVRQARVAEGSTLVNVAPGFYVVRANGTATKVIVR